MTGRNSSDCEQGPYALICQCPAHAVFTQEDVELIRGLAEYLLTGSYKRLDAIGVRVFNTQPAAALNALADRIEALLPPA